MLVLVLVEDVLVPLMVLDVDDVDDAMPARQMKCVPTAHAHGIHVIATEVWLGGAARAYRYNGVAPFTPWFRFPGTSVEFGGRF